MSRRSNTYVVTLLLAVGVLGAHASPALAKRARPSKPTHATTSPRTSEPAPASSTRKPADDLTDRDAPVTDSAPRDTASRASAGATNPPKTRVYTFGGLDLNGTLKAPQLLFFRGRVKQELDTSSPEKRSFLKELEKTADANGL